MSSNISAGISQPVRRYVPKKPNYYPAPPPEPTFYDAEPLDPHVVAIVRYLTILVFAAAIMYGVFALYNNKHPYVEDPTVLLLSIETTFFKINNSTGILTLNWKVVFHVFNWNKDWEIYFNTATAGVDYQDGNISLGWQSKTVTQQNYTRYTMDFEINVVDENVSSPYSNLRALVEDRSRGMVPVEPKLLINFQFKKVRWPYYRSHSFLTEYSCPTYYIVFSSSGQGHATNKPQNCTSDVQFLGRVE